MKAITSAFSLVALLGALVILPGCGAGDEAVPPADTPAPADGGAMEGPDAGAMEGPEAAPGGLDAPGTDPATESAAP